MPETQLTLTRIIRAPRDKVFAAWTSPEQLVKWWGPGAVTCPKAEVDLRTGGAYKIANKEQDGSITWISGTYTEVDPPNKLTYEWNVSIVDGPPTQVSVWFNPHPEGTELVITHERFTDDAVRDMHVQGWGGCLDKLDALFV